MLNFKQIITFAYESEYDSAYDLNTKKNFSTPKIYDANGDLSKRWYVYFSYRNPKTGKLKRITPFYGDANKYKTKEDRLQVLTQYRKTLLKFLQQGYSPFKDNSQLHSSLNNKTEKPVITLNPVKTKIKAVEDVIETTPIIEEKVEEPKMDIQKAFDFAVAYMQVIVFYRGQPTFSKTEKAGFPL